MALKPFYNKKGHLGMTRQQVKAALNAGASLPEISDADAGKVLGVNADGEIVAENITVPHIYQHNVYFTFQKFHITIISDQAAAFTVDTLKTWLSDKGFTSSSKGFDISGVVVTRPATPDNTFTIINYYSLYVSGGTLNLAGNNYTITLTDNTFTTTNSTSTTQTSGLSDDVIQVI